MSVINVKTTSHKKTTKVTTRVSTSSSDVSMDRRKSSFIQLTEKPAIAMAEAMKSEMIKKYSEMDIDELLSQLNENELEQLTSMVDPDDPLIPPSERCKNQTNKEPTGPLNRKKLLNFLETYAKEQEDWPEYKQYEPGVKRGRVFIAPEPKKVQEDATNEIMVELDLEDDAKDALDQASQAELVDLAAILGLHSMLSQEQYHASIQNKGQAVGATFESLDKASMPKAVPMLPDNMTNTTETAHKVFNDDDDVKDLNWNNIRTAKREDFKQLFDGLKRNTNLTTLCLANTNLTDSTAEYLIEAIKENKNLKVLNIESNYISGNMLKNLFEAALQHQTLTEVRATNQRPSILGNKIEMEIARLIELNKGILSVGLQFDVPDARVRIARQLQENRDRLRRVRMGQEE